jgi:hypothetical protein
VYESGSNKVDQMIEDTFSIWRCAASAAFVVMKYQIEGGMTNNSTSDQRIPILRFRYNFVIRYASQSAPPIRIAFSLPQTRLKNLKNGKFGDHSLAMMG